VLLVAAPIWQSRTYAWLGLPVPVRLELDEPRSDWLPDWNPEPGFGSVVPGPRVVPPTDGAAGRGVGRSDGVPGVSRGAAGVLGLRPRPESVYSVVPGDAVGVREAGVVLGALLGVVLGTLPGAEAPAPV
jgi:hypothetical protein